MTEAEAELERLFSDTTPSPNPATNGSVPAATTAESSDGTDGKWFSTLMGLSAATPVAAEPSAPKQPELTIPPIIGSLSDQALAVLKANPNQMFSGEALTGHLNRMPGRIARANVDSVNAALSRLTTDGLILRVERGLYKAKPAMNTG